MKKTRLSLFICCTLIIILGGLLFYNLNIKNTNNKNSLELELKYLNENDNLITITNTETNEFIVIEKNSDFIIKNSVFDKPLETVAGEIIFNYNDGIHNDKIVEYKSIVEPTGFYINNDTSKLYGINTINKFSEDTLITLYYDENNKYNKIKFPEEPTLEGYEFVGWYNEWYDYVDSKNYEYYGGEVLTAEWETKQLKVSYNGSDYYVDYGTEISLSDFGTEYVELAQVNFKYNNEWDESSYGYVYKELIPNNFIVNGEPYYEDTIIIKENTIIKATYEETVIPVEFPEWVYRENYEFAGWYTAKNGGKKVTEYSKDADITLYAHWNKLPLIHTPNGDFDPDINGNYNLGVNDKYLGGNTYGYVTFNPLNDEAVIKEGIIYGQIPNGWLVNWEHYNDNEVIHVTDYTTIEPYYESGNLPISFPEDPVKDKCEFIGWYDSRYGGNKYTSYTESVSITLYAHYECEEIPEDEQYILPFNHDSKENTTLSTVTFKYHNGLDDTTANVIKKYQPNGWFVDGVYHSNGDIVRKTDSTVILPSYNEVILGAEYPQTPTNGDKKFIGWYTEETGGERIFSYDGTKNLTLHAHYTDNYSMLDTGINVHNLYYQRYIERIKLATTSEYEKAVNDGLDIKLVSTPDSPYATYAYLVYNNYSSVYATLYFYTEADVIYLNPDSSHLFSKLNDLYEFDISKFDSSYVTDMSYMFYQTGKNDYTMELDLNHFDVSNVTNMSYALSYFNGKSFDISKWNTAKVEDFSYIFSGNSTIKEYDLSKLNTSSAITMEGFFDDNVSLEKLDLSNFDTSNVTNMKSMFRLVQTIKTIDLSNFDTSNVTNMSYMFYSTRDLINLNLSSFDTSNVTNMQSMFTNDESLKILNLSSFSTNKLIDINNMFAAAVNLRKIYVSPLWEYKNEFKNSYATFENVTLIDGQNGTSYKRNYISGEYARIDSLPNYPGYLINKYAKKYNVIIGDIVEKVIEGNEFLIPNDLSKYDINKKTITTVTFDPMNGEEKSYSSLIKTDRVKYLEFNENNYYSGDKIRVNNDIEFIPYYDTAYIYPEFPENPTKTGYLFKGWFDGDNQVTDLSNIKEDTTLYASYDKKKLNVVYNGETQEVDYGETIKLTSMEEAYKDDEIVSSVTLHYFDANKDDEDLYVYKSFIPAKILVNGVEFNFGDEYIVTEDTKIDVVYIETIVPVQLPDKEEVQKDYYEFVGWYLNDEFNGPTITSYSEEISVDVFAKYNIGKVNVYINDDYDNPIEYTYGDTYTFGKLPEEADIYMGDVTFIFDYEGNIPDEIVPMYAHIKCEFFSVYDDNNYSGGVYHEGDTITLYSDTYIYTDTNDKYKLSQITIPNVPNRDYYIFEDWYDDWGNIVDSDYEFEPYQYIYAEWSSIPVIVHTPEDDYEYSAGDEYYLDYNDYSKSDIIGATVTFKYHDDLTDDYIENVMIKYEPNGWLVNGVHYDNYEYIILEGETTIEPDYVEIINEIEFPENPTMDNYEFIGWYTEEIYGEEVVSYNKKEDTILHAHWNKELPKIKTPEGIDYPSEDGSYILGTNSYKKENKNIGEVVFKLQNNEKDIIIALTKLYEPNGWLINGKHYDDSETIMVFEDCEIIPDYIETINEIEFPKDPIKYGYKFTGWYKDAEAIKYKYNQTKYNGNDSMVLYAGWDLIPIVKPTKIETGVLGENKIISNISKNNTDLVDLKVVGHTISPEFKSNVTEYVVNVKYDEKEIEIIAKAQKGATVEITGNKNLHVGENKVLIKVTDENNYIKYYTIKVIKDSKKTKSFSIFGLNFIQFMLFALLLIFILFIFIIILKKDDDDEENDDNNDNSNNNKSKKRSKV